MLYWISKSKTDSRDDPLQETMRLNLSFATSLPASRRIAILRAFLTLLFFIFALTEAFRIYQVSARPRPRIPFDSNLRIRSSIPAESARLGVNDGDLLLLANQKPVSNRDDLDAAFHSSKGQVEQLSFKPMDSQASTQQIDVFWREVSDHPHFETDQSMKLTTGPQETEEFFGLIVTSVNGVEVETSEDVQWALKNLRRKNPTLHLLDQIGNPIVLAYTVVDWSARTTTLLVGMLIGATALTVAWLRGGSMGAWGFVLFGLNVAVFGISRAMPFDYRLSLENFAYFVSQVCLPATGAVFLVTFASLRVLVGQTLSKYWVLAFLLLGGFAAYLAAQKTTTYAGIEQRGWADWVFVAVMIPSVLLASNLIAPKRFRVNTTTGVILFGAAVTLTLVLSSAFFFSGETSVGIIGMPLFYAWQIFTLSLILLCLGSNFILKMARVPVPSLDRRRSAILMISMLCSFLPMAIYHLLRINYLETFTAIRPFTELAQVIFPVTIAYGIVRQNILQLSRFFLEAVAYVLILTAGFVGYILIGTFLVSTNSQAGQTIIASAFVMTIMASLLLVLHNFVNSKFKPWGENTPEIEEEFLDALHDSAVNAQSVNHVYDFVDKELRETLQVTNVDLLLTTNLIADIESVPDDGAPLDRLNSLEDGDAVIRVASMGDHFFVRDLEEQIQPSATQRNALEALHGLSSDLVFPVRSSTRTVGTLCLGAKMGGTNFTRREIEFLKRSTRRLGASLSAIARREQETAPRRIIDLFPRFPSSIEDFKILGVLGQGGMSYVYLGERDGGRAAVKVANHRVQMNPMLRSRFNREWEILSTIPHQRIVSLLDHGQVGSEPYMVFEYMQNGTLADALRQNGPLVSTDVIRLIRDVVEGLVHALKHGVIHRDLKPHNLFLDNDGLAKISDFGAARLEEDDHFTITGEIIGTLAYMAPERLEGRASDWRVDQYALGVTVYELLAGRKPFAGRTIEAQMVSKLNWTVNNHVQLATYADERLARTISRMLASDPDGRFGAYDDLLEALPETDVND